MAQVKLNPVLLCLLGQIGGFVYKTRRGKMYASRKPVFKPGHFNDAQKAVQVRFGRASRYAMGVMADPEARAPYDMVAKTIDASVQNLIVADFIEAPSVDEIDLRDYDGEPGSTIRIRASDDFDVMAVHVVVSGPAGEEIERGGAIPSSRELDCWVYTATTSAPPHVRVEATATDRPGNKTTKVENT